MFEHESYVFLVDSVELECTGREFSERKYPASVEVFHVIVQLVIA